ncbi:MAG: LysR family transcriptional regulator [Gemmobacter sp.]|jgi:DNA-binding transcriptional LysR family regulator|nr:LysR family transcriptional regulator [Gemmobacter sp.]
MIETIRRSHSDDTVSVGATLAFSHFWILPRLSEFRARHPGIRPKLVAEDRTTDLRRDRLDVCIRFARPLFADGNSIVSHPDMVFPVCSPALPARTGADARAVDITRMPLIAADSVNPVWLSWRSWAQAVGLGPELARASDRSSLRFNHYTDSIEAALNGEGVALGWSMLLSGHLAAGRLVRIGGHVLTTPEKYHASVPLGRQPTTATACFIEWPGERFASGAGSGKTGVLPTEYIG